MEIIELTAENIEQYLDDCVSLQAYLVSDPTRIDSDTFRETARCTHSFFAGVLHDNHVVGMCVVSKLVHPVAITGYVNNIVVHPDMQGNGLFTMLMDAIEECAQKWNCTNLSLTCSRETVKPLYEKRGYSEKETNFYTKKI